ncbi:uncharacterized protein [Centruroides vittatus]|uniref:uncharacterized protein n=1 Tax=Centruroides vittatus TaxID=120091 RepID=UPI003510473E
MSIKGDKRIETRLNISQLSVCKLFSMQMKSAIKSTKRQPSPRFKRISQGEESYLPSIEEKGAHFTKSNERYRFGLILKIIGVWGVIVLCITTWTKDTSSAIEDSSTIEAVYGDSPKVSILIGILLMVLGIFSFFIDFGNSVDYRLIGGVLLTTLILSLVALSLALSDENDLTKALQEDIWHKNKTGSDFEEVDCPNITADDTEYSKEILAVYEELGCGNSTEIPAIDNDNAVAMEKRNKSTLNDLLKKMQTRVKRKASKPRTFSGIRSSSFFRPSYRKYQLNSGNKYSRFGDSKGHMYAYKYNGRYYYRNGAQGSVG